MEADGQLRTNLLGYFLAYGDMLSTLLAPLLIYSAVLRDYSFKSLVEKKRALSHARIVRLTTYVCFTRAAGFINAVQTFLIDGYFASSHSLTTFINQVVERLVVS